MAASFPTPNWGENLFEAGLPAKPDAGLYLAEFKAGAYTQSRLINWAH